MTTQRNILTTSVLGLIALGVLTTTSRASLISSSAGLPPAGVYLSTDIHQIYTGPALTFLLSLPEHAPLANEVVRTPGGNGAPGTPLDEVEHFGSTLDAHLQVVLTSNPSNVLFDGPIHANGGPGSVSTLVQNKIGNTTGTFQTEMLQLDLSGTVPGLGGFMIRESPTRQSTGLTAIADIGGGLFQIDSFFDVFTELSVDGGATWMAGSDSVGGPPAPGHVTLQPLPEPGTLLWGAAMGLAVACRRVRARRA